MLVTDAQVHIWEPDRPDRPWPRPFRGTPHRENGFSAEEAIVAMDRVGVDRAILVPPTLAGEGNETVREAAERYASRFAVMGRFDPNSGVLDEELGNWLAQPGFLGIRLTFVAVPRLEQLEDGSLDHFWAACERYRIPLMVLMNGSVHYVRPIAERHPGLTLILDHIGLRIQTNPPSAAWRDLDAVVGLAGVPNVSVKVSSVPNFSDESYPYRDVHEHVRRLYDSFGPHRLYWGSDVTRLRGGYEECLNLFRHELDFLSPDDRALILGGALSATLDWPEKPPSQPGKSGAR